MSIGHIKTPDIFVFPSTRRMNKQVSARLMSEASLASIVNKLIETSGFVITPEPESGQYAEQGFDPTLPFEFNVYGYFFRVETAQKILDLFSSGDTTIYANIFLDKTTDPNYTELSGVDGPLSGSDDTEVYKGLTLSTDDLTQLSTGAADYSLCLFQKDTLSGGGTGWVVPLDSRLKFYYTFALGVDGGEILSATT